MFNPTDFNGDTVRVFLKDLYTAGFSYSRIAMRTRCSPSGIQKIAATPREPREGLIIRIVLFYRKIFKFNRTHPLVRPYYEIHGEIIDERIELIERYLTKKMVPF